MKLFTLFIAFTTCLYFTALGQRPQPDVLRARKGNITIQPITHGSLVLTWDGRTVYVDPYGGAEGYAGLADPDVILITDIHGDHLDLKTLQVINTSKAIIVAPQAVADKLPEDLKKKAFVMANGDKTCQSDMGITAIPMYNLPETAESRHPRGRGNGYVISMGGKNIYLSGDTGDIPEMRKLEDIDVAFICMNLPYTMDVDHAASGVLAFKPRIVYPYHYRGQNGLSDVERFKTLVNQGNKKIEVRLRDWYPGG